MEWLDCYRFEVLPAEWGFRWVARRVSRACAIAANSRTQGRGASEKIRAVRSESVLKPSSIESERDAFCSGWTKLDKISQSSMQRFYFSDFPSTGTSASRWNFGV